MAIPVDLRAKWKIKGHLARRMDAERTAIYRAPAASYGKARSGPGLSMGVPGIYWGLFWPTDQPVVRYPVNSCVVELSRPLGPWVRAPTGWAPPGNPLWAYLPGVSVTGAPLYMVSTICGMHVQLCLSHLRRSASCPTLKHIHIW